MAESASIVSTARQGAEASAAQGSVFAGGSDAILQTAIWLLVIVGLILLLAWGVRRFTNIGPKSAGAMRVLSALPIGNRERIALVQVGDKQILIGVAPGHVSTLHVFEENIVSPNAGTPYGPSAAPELQGFGQVLRNTLRGSGRSDGRDSH